MAGQEGVEPPTPGFGVRCSANWSYWPAANKLLFNFCFFMYQMLVAKFAVFFQLDFIRCLALVFCACIVPALAFCACKGNQYSVHC